VSHCAGGKAVRACDESFPLRPPLRGLREATIRPPSEAILDSSLIARGVM
jgi:hypothetical protein